MLTLCLLSFLLPALSAPAPAATITELVALGPNAGGPNAKSTALEWVQVSYAAGVSSSKDVTITPVKQATAALGAWYGLDPGGLALTAKIAGDNMYGLHNKAAPSAAGCCADTLRVFAKAGGDAKEIDLKAPVQKALNSSDAYPSHTFDMNTVGGKLVALLQVKYTETELGTAYGDAIVAVDVATGEAVPTADGAVAFSICGSAGTESWNLTDSRFKMQCYYDTASYGEQWHGNGVLRFSNKAGVQLLGFTHRAAAEAIIFKDPWTYKAAAGGGSILQRFGTPWGWTNETAIARRYFGLKSSAAAFSSGVHNVFYRAESEGLSGKESISLFVNSQVDSTGTHSQAYEFELNLVEEGSAADTGDDKVFATNYVSASCSFTAKAQGGARSIGNGVFLVMSGADETGLEVADTAGQTQSHAYSDGSAFLYDPFIRVVVSGDTQLVEDH